MKLLLLMASNVRLAILPVLVIMLLRPYKAVAAPNNLTAGGDALTPPRYITSPSGIFAFGFRALDSDPTKFILAIWFRSDAGNGDSWAQSVVWFAKESPSGRTAVATAESVLSITVDGQLALTGGGKQEQLWTAPVTTSQQRGSVLTLRDSGNLQLLGPAAGDDDGAAADASNVVWQSFWYPTDTLLPGQSLTKDDTRSEGKLFSKRADAEFTTGRFSMGVQTDGNIVLYLDLLTGNSPSNAYWQAYTDDSSDGNTTVTFDDQGRLNYTLYNGTVGSLITPPAAGGGGYFRFARMDPDGVVRAYYRPRNKGGTLSWSISGSFPSEACNKWASGPRGMCGPGSYCVETPKRLSCLCPSGYTYADEQHKDEGCWPEFVPQSCGGGGNSSSSGSGSGSGSDFDFVELPRTTWEWDGSAYYKKFTSVTEEQCRSYCLSDCFCAAALLISGSDGGGGSDYQCLEAALLTNARQRNDDATRKVLVKVRNGGNTTPSSAEARTRRRMLRPYKVITVCLAFLLAISVATAVTCKLWQGYTNTKAKRRESLLSGGLTSFTYKELERATNGFRVQLGKGAFGQVYKGKVSYPLQPPLQVAVAVKRLMKSDAAGGYSGRDFQNELQSVGQIHHRYLVRMIGYCQERAHRMLVFEYMQGGTLADFIFRPSADQSNRPCWSCIAEAAVGIAKGLEYLHEGCKSQIIHCDIKPDNILFDDKHTPKITDFGIAKLLGDQRTQYTITRPFAGTRPYIAPEWFVDEATAKVDSKVDVYSFGVMLLEMICCRRTAAWAWAQQQQQQQPNDLQGESTMRAWAESLLRRGRAEVLVQGESEALADMESVERFTRVAIWCMQREPSARPRMCKVVQMLQGTVDVDPLPDPPRPLPFSAVCNTPRRQREPPHSAVALEID